MRNGFVRRASIAAALVPAIFLGAAATAGADEFVNADGDGAGGCTSAPHATIQAGVNAASPGETVVVCPGTYREQVEAIDKSVAIVGSGEASTTLESPDAAGLVANWRADSRRAILAIEDTSPATTPVTVDVSDLRVDGRNQGACHPAQNFGIGYYNASGAVSDVVVDDVRQIASGCQQGNAIYALDDTPAPHSVAVEDSVVTDYQKNGITANGAGLTATIRGNEVTGAGAQPNIAQNGIQLFGSGGTVADNEVAGNECDHASCGDDVLTETMSGGLLVIDVADGTRIADNVVHDNDIGIFDVAINDKTSDPAKDASGNVLADNRYIGIYTDEGELTATGNEVSGSDRGIAAVSWEDGATDYVPVAEIDGNHLTGNEVAIDALSGGAGAAPPAVSAAFNRIAGNASAIANHAGGTLVAENNWFGSNAGPGGTVGAGVDATPFLLFGLKADPDAILVGGEQSRITASVAANSAGATPAGNSFPTTPVEVETDLGSVGDATLVGGSGQATLTSGEALGTAHVTGSLDGAVAGAEVIFETFIPAGGGEPPLPGPPTGVGTDAADALIGGDGDDVLSGLAGDDTILGGLGDDIIRGGTGTDLVSGGSGNDDVGGGFGADEVAGGQGDDVIRGGPGPDALDGGRGADDFSGGRGQDEIAADDGEADTINCGLNVDTVAADEKDDVSSNCEIVA